jgi:hypothetical protein
MTARVSVSRLPHKRLEGGRDQRFDAHSSRVAPISNDRGFSTRLCPAHNASPSLNSTESKWFEGFEKSLEGHMEEPRILSWRRVTLSRAVEAACASG